MLEVNDLQIYFVSMLPGLGKSTISDDSHDRGINNMFDLEDLIEQVKPFYKANINYDSNGLGYKDIFQTDDVAQKAIEVVKIIKLIVGFTSTAHVDKVYIFSSIWWEHIGVVNTDIFVSMEASKYNGVNLKARGREDLADKFSDNILYDWANGFINPSRNATAVEGTFVSTALAPGEFLSLERLRALVNKLFKDLNPVILIFDEKLESIHPKDGKEEVNAEKSK